ncbi:arylsulfatase [Achlya hypogyna]|uniref:Arylsulfatase n=1 Tax=Achlya hypogyna TaxID=1202772 RepID=A0A1V9YCM5_ACHHY|nr:arylsulfatase [Achlya hypogyna]
MRVVLIHALRHSQAPIEAAFARSWPQASLANLTDDSLAADLAALVAQSPPTAGAPPQLYTPIQERFHTLSNYAVQDMQADAILFTCSAFGGYIDAAARAVAPVPVLKPNEAMLDDMVGLAKDASPSLPFVVALAATFAPTLDSMLEEIDALVTSEDCHMRIVPVHVEGALEALNKGNTVLHNELVATKLDLLLQSETVDAIALAQFSLAQSAPLVESVTKKRVLTTPDSAVAALQRRLVGRR